MNASRKAKLIGLAELRRLSSHQGERYVYRQTFNSKTGYWTLPQRKMTQQEIAKYEQWRLNDGKPPLKKDIEWVAIKNANYVLNPRDGRSFALWRMMDILRRKKDASGSTMWNCAIYKLKRPPYSHFYLIAVRIKNDIRGVF